MQLDIGRYAKLQGSEIGLERYYAFEKYISDAGVLVVSTTLSSFVGDEESDPIQLQGASLNDSPPPVKLARPISRLPFSFSANGDRIILSPNVNNGLIENILLDITVKDLYDLHGNKLASPVTWSAYVDRNQVFWEEESRRFEINFGSSLSFRAKIRNSSGIVQQFDIRNLPEWLQANPQAGTISPLSSKEIEFTISEGINIGQYVQDIYVRTNFGFDERLVLDVKVRKEAPSIWDVDPGNYQFSMSVIGQIRMDGTFSRDGEDKIAAFVNNEPRGSAQLQYMPTLDSYIAFLSIYSNESSGETVDFRVWNASEGQIHGQVLPTYTFVSNMLHGSINTPVIFEVPNFVEQEISLRQGWQWVSFNLDDPNMSAVESFMAPVAASEGDIIKGLAHFDQYDPVLGWVGSLTQNGGLRASENYKIKLRNSSTLRYDGGRVDPEDVPISLRQGWNWIGFTPQRNLSIEAAFSRLNPEVGDQVKSQLEFSVYAGGNAGWFGTLTTLEPGKGYMFYSNREVTFSYPNITAVFSEVGPHPGARLAEVNPTLDPREYRDNMTLIAEVPGVTLSDDHVLVAYVDGQERGVSTFKAFSEDRKVAFVTILGEGHEGELNFQLRDLASQQVTNLTADRRMDFNQDGVSGSLAAPVIMQPIESSSTKGNLQLMPNPLSDQMTLVLEDPKERLRRVEIFSVNGERLAVIESENAETLIRSYRVSLSRWIGNRRGVLIVKVYTDKDCHVRRAIRR